MTRLVTLPHNPRQRAAVVLSRDAANLRAKYGLRTPDALQIAGCLTAGAIGFLTSERHLRRVSEIDVLMIQDFDVPWSDVRVAAPLTRP